MVYSVYDEADVGRFRVLLETMQLLKDDYLGGQGSRGSGRVRFRNLLLSLRSAGRYGELRDYPQAFAGLPQLVAQASEVVDWAREAFLAAGR